MGFARSIVNPNLLPRGVLCPTSLLPELRSALFPLCPLARHLMPVVPFGGIFAAGSLNVHCAGFSPAFFVHRAGYYPAFFVHCAGFYPAFFVYCVRIVSGHGFAAIPLSPLPLRRLGVFSYLPLHSSIRQPLADVPASLLPPQGKNRLFKHLKGGD